MDTAHTPPSGSADHGAAHDRETVEIVLPGKVEPDGLQITRRPLPPPEEGRAVLRVEATGVSFAEQQMRRGKYFDQPPFPFVPGYDLIGTVTEVGPGVSPETVGRRYAAVTKTGAWAGRVAVPAGDLVPVPDGVDPAEAETLVVNGLTAWQMLHRVARVRRGATVLVHGANGGVGSTLAQLARHAGIRVVGTASPRHHDAVRALGAIPLDYRAGDLAAQVRALAPAGVAAVFDHVGGPGITDSFRVLARGGTLVSYGTASTRDVAGSSHLPVLRLLLRLAVWRVLPNGRRTHFYNLWAGRRNARRFRARMRRDLGTVFGLLADGGLRAQVAARLPLTEAGAAMALAESGTVIGKVVLVGSEEG
ncbi:medium chain dehydrogenase/reductase family protein [Streptomonospora wellingtoniae]|uniref:Medium chain dehydrogenase/reductase family protein n=1 Tax=Streptomonospora wellingtoniae TaxID=3075544 RepID=A0ABU2L0Z7_9ACTN|nr:medium chain dehydrogenase/reductase family protein [Streptomonospora sp. DSM 45055]MDT0305205.1 medium chain dehydrogenase/reductase family protein [Streptomonospora sp. DSM 45055]